MFSGLFYLHSFLGSIFDLSYSTRKETTSENEKIQELKNP